MNTKLKTIRAQIIKDLLDMEQERHRLFFPATNQTAEKMLRYAMVSKYQQNYLKMLSVLDGGEDYVKAHLSGKLSTVLKEFEQK